MTAPTRPTWDQLAQQVESLTARLVEAEQTNELVDEHLNDIRALLDSAEIPQEPFLGDRVQHCVDGLAEWRKRFDAQFLESEILRTDLGQALMDRDEARAQLAAAEGREAAQIEHTERFDVLVIAVDQFLNVNIPDDECPFLECDYDEERGSTPIESHSEECPIRKLADAYRQIPESYVASSGSTAGAVLAAAEAFVDREEHLRGDTESGDSETEYHRLRDAVYPDRATREASRGG